MDERTQSETIGSLAMALSKAQAYLNGAVKDSANHFFKSKYADLHTCIQAAKEPLADNELCVIQTTDENPEGIVIITTLAHSSGEWIRGRLFMKPKKDDDQGRGSSITYGRRYAFAAIIGLAQKDDDGNSASGRDPQVKTNKLTPDQEQLKQCQEWLDGISGKIDYQELWDKHHARAKKNLSEASWVRLLKDKAEIDKSRKQAGL